MSFPATIIPAKRRIRRKPRPVETSSPPAGVALLIALVEDLPPDEAWMRLTFDTTEADPLIDVSTSDPAKWTLRYGGVAYVSIGMNNDAADVLVLHLGATGADAGPNVISYSNAPSDISDTSGRQLAALSDFPVVP